MAAGIDYSLGTANYDAATGIHYGVINHAEVGQNWWDSSEAQYGEPACPYCGSTDLNVCSAFHVLCRDCGKDMREDECQPEEPLAYIYEDEDYAIEQGADDGDLFVLRSKYYSLSQYCSPCAPGAGFLLAPDPEGIKTYCLDGSWFPEDVAPYPVYSVATGERVS